MLKYVKKAIVVEAMQWFKHGDYPEAVQEAPLPDDEIDRICVHCGLWIAEHGWIKTLEGGHIVCSGDWIITGVKGERYPCKPEIFVMTYDPLGGQWRNCVHKEGSV